MKKMKFIFAMTAAIVMCVYTASAQEPAAPESAFCATRVADDPMFGGRTFATSAPVGELLVFLDMDGAQVRRGNSNSSGYVSEILNLSFANVPQPNLTQAAKDQVVDLVRDDFSPFNIRVTTDQAEFQAYEPSRKQICIVTTTPQVIGFSSGVAGVSPFAGIGFRISSSPCFVFASVYGPGRLADIADTVSHEVGHTFGLGHQHHFTQTCGFAGEYRPRFGSGALSFGPLMGDAPGARISNWYAQGCLSPMFQVPQDDYALISNEVAVKEDDFSNVIDTRGAPLRDGFEGILERGGDVDVVKVNLRAGRPISVTSDNIDLKIVLMDARGRLIAESNDPDDISASVQSGAGVSYLAISAEPNNPNVAAQFMTGKYRVSF